MRANRRKPPPVRPAEPPTAGEALGEELKAMFDSLASEPLPKEILDLVDELDGKTKRRRRDGSH